MKKGVYDCEDRQLFVKTLGQLGLNTYFWPIFHVNCKVYYDETAKNISCHYGSWK